MQIAVLIEREGWLTGDLRRAATDIGVSLTTIRWSDLSATLSDDSATIHAKEIVLSDADAMLVRTMRAATSEQIFFRMDALQQLAAHGVPVINTPRAVEVSVDKYLSLARIRAAGLPVPNTFAGQKCADAMQAFEQLGGEVVVKPLFGSEGFGLTRISDPNLAMRAFTQLERMGAVIYVQRFVRHDGTDLRLFVLDDRVLTAMRRRGLDWRTNIALGGHGEPVEPPSQVVDLAIRAAQACEAQIAGVDILVSDDGEPYVLEVNAVPGWRRLAEVTGVDVTQQVLAYVRDQQTA